MTPKHRLITSSEINVWSPQAVLKEAVIFMRSWEPAEARCTIYILGMIHLYTHVGNPIQEYILNVYISLGHLRNIFTGCTDPSLTSESRFSVPLVRQADKIWAPLTRFILNTLGNRSFSYHCKQLEITNKVPSTTKASPSTFLMVLSLGSFSMDLVGDFTYLYRSREKHIFLM